MVKSFNCHSCKKRFRNKVAYYRGEKLCQKCWGFKHLKFGPIKIKMWKNVEPKNNYYSEYLSPRYKMIDDKGADVEYFYSSNTAKKMLKQLEKIYGDLKIVKI